MFSDSMRIVVVNDEREGAAALDSGTTATLGSLPCRKLMAVREVGVISPWVGSNSCNRRSNKRKLSCLQFMRVPRYAKISLTFACTVWLREGFR
jgi:hypothetical protein